MNFQEFTEHVESRIGEHNQVGVWDSEITEITEIGYNFLKCLITFRKEDFAFVSEYNFVEEHFKEEEDFTNEVLRLTKRLDDYTKAIEELSVSQELEFTNVWQSKIESIFQESPITSHVVILFFKETSDGHISLTKNVYITSEGFISKEWYLNNINDIVNTLNQPIDISYYQQIINSKGF